MTARAQLNQQNVAAAAKYTEYTLVIPMGAMQPTIQLRNIGGTPANLYWYMAPTGNASPGSSGNLPSVYNTIPAGGSRTIFGVLGGQTIYFQVDQTSQVLEFDYYADA